MALKALTTAALIFFATTTHAASQSTLPTATGNLWNTLPDEMRTLLITGVYEGFATHSNLTSLTCAERANDGKQLQCMGTVNALNDLVTTTYLKTKTVGQIQAGVDDFYKDYRNLGLPLNEAVFVVIRRINGDPNVETYLTNIRSQY